MIEFEYIPVEGDYSHENTDKTYQILEYRFKVYEGVFLFDNGLVLSEKFSFYSQNLNSNEFLRYQNIKIKAFKKPCRGILIVKKMKLK